MAVAAQEAGVLLERAGGVVTVSWARGPLNIFDGALIKELGAALRTPEVHEARVVVLRGRGSCWSAGFAVEDHLKPKVTEMMGAFRELIRTLRDVPSPILAEVRGHCLGGGLEVLMACDLAFGGASSTFGQPEVRLGVFAPFGVVAYPRLLGERRARELLFLGATLSAEEALRMGILNRVAADATLSEEVARAASTLAGYRPSALRLMKRLMREEPAPGLLRAEQVYLYDLMNEEGAEDGLRAFLEAKASPSRRALGGART